MMAMSKLMAVRRIARNGLVGEVVSARKAVCVVALTMALMVFAGTLAAQEKTAPAQPQSPAGDSASQPANFGRRLAHETREATGGEEKDDKAEFRRSPSVGWIARKFGVSLQAASLLSVLLNFAVIAGIFFWAGRKYLPGAFRARTESIQKAMQEAQKASEEARRRLADIESRLMKLDAEIGVMRESAEKEAAADEARIQAAAEEDARKIVQSAEQEIAAAIKTARRELTAYAADLAVGLAQKQIHVDAATDRAIVQNFSRELGVAPSGPGSGSGKGGN
jgi:F-type H+-transporting ATPase subunit b